MYRKIFFHNLIFTLFYQIKYTYYIHLNLLEKNIVISLNFFYYYCELLNYKINFVIFFFFFLAYLLVMLDTVICILL